MSDTPKPPETVTTASMVVDEWWDAKRIKAAMRELRERQERADRERHHYEEMKRLREAVVGWHKAVDRLFHIIVLVLVSILIGMTLKEIL